MDSSPLADSVNKTAVDQQHDAVVRLRRLHCLQLRLPMFDQVDEVFLTLVRGWPELFIADRAVEAGDIPSQDGGHGWAAHDGQDLTRQLHEAELTITGLRLALETNRVIATACGIIMACRKVTQAQAFELLKTASQPGNASCATLPTRSSKLDSFPTCPRVHEHDQSVAASATHQRDLRPWTHLYPRWCPRRTFRRD